MISTPFRPISSQPTEHFSKQWDKQAVQQNGVVTPQSPFSSNETANKFHWTGNIDSSFRPSRAFGTYLGILLLLPRNCRRHGIRRRRRRLMKPKEEGGGGGKNND